MYRAILIFLLVATAAVPAATSTQIHSAQRRISFNEDWRFLKTDAVGVESPGFDDSAWRTLDLPHDWAIEGPFDSKYDPKQGGLPFYGTAWYRKHFTVAPGLQQKFISLEFDGAMSNSEVWLNGHELGGRPYGYIGFAFEIWRWLHFGDENVLAVKLAPEDLSSRWYPGAGIYRNVWLDVAGPVHVAHWGTYVTTPEVTDASATVAIQTTVQNSGTEAVHVIVDTAILDAKGKRVASATSPATIPADGKLPVDTRVAVAHPQRWDMDHPYLYEAVTTIKHDGGMLDRYVTPFGIRTIEFDAAKGFLLNGRHVKLQGVCNHHDLGALGAAVNRRATERQLQIMKSMGVNAIRTSHNPPSPELLEFCDRLGLVVMDEAFDMWRSPR